MMKSDKRLPFTQWTDVFRTERFISVETLSGYSFVEREDDRQALYFFPDVSTENLGQAFLRALDASRFIWPLDEPEFFKAERYMHLEQNWQQESMLRFRYKTKRDLYQNIHWCRAERTEGIISIEPHKADSEPEGFEWLPPEMNVVIPETRDPVAAGAALRLALDRCK